jgi:hypothetical protein
MKSKSKAKEETPMNSISHHPQRHPSTINPKQPQPKADRKEMIAANVKSLIEQLEAGHSMHSPPT